MDAIPYKLEEWLQKQTRERLIEIMIEALSLMQYFNGRTLTHCICTAAGWEEVGEGKWKLSPKKK